MSPSLPNSCIELSHSSEATKARWASENARWTWNILNAFRPTLLPEFRGSSTHMGSNLPDWNCCFCVMFECVFWMLNCRCKGVKRCGFGAKGSDMCASWERKKYCLVRTLMPKEERVKMREKEIKQQHRITKVKQERTSDAGIEIIPVEIKQPVIAIAMRWTDEQ